MIPETLYALPEPAPKVMPEKRGIRMPDLNVLNVGQLEAATGLLDYLGGNSDWQMAMLLGNAGTGKTFTMSVVVETFLSKVRGYAIAVSAPTNKAVRVGRWMAAYTDPSIQYATIHSLLGLKQQIGNDGEVKFLPDRSIQAKLENFNILIVDEVSMLNDELFDLLVPYVHERGLRIIFVGDPCQIPPVRAKGASGEDAKPLLPAMQIKHKIGVFRLNEVVRQAADNPIIQLATHVRENLSANWPVTHSVFPESSVLPNGDGVYILREDNRALLDLLKLWFTSENFQQNADFCRVIAWTNNTVNRMNNLIRKFIFGKEAPAYCVGEKLVADVPVLAPDDASVIIYTTNDEFEIEELKLREETFRISGFNNMSVHLKYYWATVFGNGRREQIRLLHEESVEDFAEMMGLLADAAKEHAKRGAGAPYWKAFFGFRDRFAQVKYLYALTCHKAQGSTFTNVIVIESDMDENLRREERNRIKYTAFTRPTSKLVIPC